MSTYKEVLITKIITIRKAIRYHRDQRGDDRCWLDDYLIWELLPDSQPKPTSLPLFEKFMEKCREFYDYRSTNNLPSTELNVTSEASGEPISSDQDLQMMEVNALQNQLMRIINAVKKHRDINQRPKTFKDDQQLYQVLPEPVLADFRLPDKESFLGTARKNAGCHNFWKSHLSCPKNNTTFINGVLV